MNIKNNLENKKNKIKNDIKGQGAAEYILLFGGVIIIAISAILIYKSYFTNNEKVVNSNSDISKLRDTINISG